MFKKLFSTAVCCFILFCIKSSAQLTVTGGAGVSAANLVNAILGPGITATNISYTGSPLSKGIFNASGTNLFMNSGIILSTGNAALGPMQPASSQHSSYMLGNADAQLDALAAPHVTMDASVLEFDFTVASDSMTFNYVFGSEEYNDYVNTGFNDVFAFYISGPGITGSKNMALLPGTNQPVSINTVNNGGPYPGVASGPCTNCSYFVDNAAGATVFLDGFTTPIAATSAVHPCETYHMKIAIADVNDQAFDSDVFIKQGSFSNVGQITLFVNDIPVENLDTIYGCAGSTVTLSLPLSGNYLWSNGSTTQQITVAVPAAGTFNQYSGYATDSSGFACFAFTSDVWIAQGNPPSAAILGNDKMCEGASTTLTASAGVGFLWSTGATTKAITANATGTYTVTVTLSGGCTAVVSKTVSAYTPPVPLISGGTTPFCNGYNTQLNASIGYSSYLWSTGSTLQAVSLMVAGTYTVTVTDLKGCTGSATKAISQYPTIVLSETHVNPSCYGSSNGSIDLTVSGGVAPFLYKWNFLPSTQDRTNLIAGIYKGSVTDQNGCSEYMNITLTEPPILSVTSTFINATCTAPNSGSINITVAGGTQPYTYVWNSGSTTEDRNQIKKGNYTVTITDAKGCTVQTSLTIGPAQISVALYSTGFCNNSLSGSITANAGPYSPTYTYLWNNGATNQNLSSQAPGTYIVTVSDINGCSATKSKVIPNPPALVATTTQVNEPCYGNKLGSISLVVTGGVPGYYYNWSNGKSTQSLTNLAVGSYSVTITDLGGCIKTISTAITQPPAITYSSSITKVSCYGGNDGKIILTAAGGTSTFAYSWNTTPVQTLATASSLTAGSYKCTISDGNACIKKTTNIAISQPSQLVATVTKSGSTATVTASGGTAPYHYSWNTVPVQTKATATGLAIGTYTATVTDAKNCTQTGSIAMPFARSGMQGAETGFSEDLSELRLYPNPAFASATLEFNGYLEGKAQISVYDLIGKQLMIQDIHFAEGNNQYKLDLTNYLKGVYTVRVVYKGVTKNIKLIIQ